MLKKIPSDKIDGTKNAVFFISRAPIHHSLTFSLRFLYEQKHQKLCVGFSIFESVSLLLMFMFLFNKTHGLFDFKTSYFFTKLK